MRRRSPLVLLVAVLIVGWYALRAGTGWVGGIALAKGKRLAAAGHYDEALPHVEKGAVGFHRSAMLWLAGQVRMGVWQNRRLTQEPVADSEHLLADAFRDYTEAITMSPGSGWYWAGLADVYHQRERVERFESGLPLELLGDERWAFVGLPGRIAVGMTRTAIRREPNTHVFHDQLAFELLDYGLRDEAFEAVRRSAEALPRYFPHGYQNLDPVPEGLEEAFLEAARGALGRTPWLPRALHMISLGELQMAMGRYEGAEADLRASLEEPGPLAHRALAYYYLGRTLHAQQRRAEAEEALLQSLPHLNSKDLALAALGEVAREDGRLEDALEYYRRLRRLQPKNMGYAMVYARVAGELGAWDRQQEALRWAATLAPGDPRPVAALVQSYLSRGDPSGAARALRDLRRIAGTEEQVRRFEKEIRGLGKS